MWLAFFKKSTPLRQAFKLCAELLHFKIANIYLAQSVIGFMKSTPGKISQKAALVVKQSFLGQMFYTCCLGKKCAE